MKTARSEDRRIGDGRSAITRQVRQTEPPPLGASRVTSAGLEGVNEPSGLPQSDWPCREPLPQFLASSAPWALSVLVELQPVC